MFIIFIDAQIISILSVYSFLVITFIMLVLSLPSLNISLSYNSVIWNTWELIYELFSTDSSGKWIQITLAPFQEFRLKLEISSSVPPPVLIPVSACLHCLGFTHSLFCFCCWLWWWNGRLLDFSSCVQLSCPLESFPDFFNSST